MSRIAGMISSDARRPCGRWAEDAAPALWGRGCGQGPVEAPGCALLWRGVGEAQVAAKDGWLLVWDGHVYNRDELGGGLQRDADLVLDLARAHGLARALTMINGDFAVAAFDPADRSLHLGRDRFGVRPLYYCLPEGGLAFASRPGALFHTPGLDRSPNRVYVGLYAASHYRAFDNDPAASPYAGIRQLPAAHVLSWRDGRAMSQPYWRLEDGPEANAPEEELAERYRELLRDSVRRRTALAGKPAFLLSGGMDSSSVLSLAKVVGGRKLHAYSSVYEDRTYDESDDIKPMLDWAVEQWHPVRVEPADVFPSLGEMIAAHDEPVATATWLAHHLCCRRAAEDGFTSLFGGLGGDELNAGEYEYFFFHFADLHWGGREKDLEEEIERWAYYHDHPVYRKNRAVALDGIKRLTAPRPAGACLPDLLRLRRYQAALNHDYFDLTGFVPVMEHPFSSHLKNRAYQDLTRETTPCCLRAEDRQANAWGLDHFDPFLDHRLVEFMFRVPGRLKIRRGVTKHLLRLAMRGVLPEETRTRVAKTGWNAPAHLWFSGPGRDYLMDMVRSSSFRGRGIYHPSEVERIIDEHQAIVSDPAPRENHMMFLWQLVNLELWLRQLEGRA